MALTKITRGVIKANENYDTHNINSTGIVTAVSANFTGNVSIGGTLTYQDVTNIDSVGVITARNGLHVTSGNVAIGHNNPLNTLHVKGPTGGVSARFTDAVNATVFVSHPSAGKSKIADSGGNYGFEFDTASVNILSGGSERLRIDSSGDVGIGTDNPSSDGGTTLEIYNATTPTLKLNDGGDYKALFQLRGNDLEIRGSNGQMEFYTGNADGASSTERLRIDSSGNLTAVNTSSGGAVTLKVGANAVSGINNGTIIINNGGTGDAALQFDYENSAARAKIYVYRSEQGLRFDTAGSERLRIDSSGRTLISTQIARNNFNDSTIETRLQIEAAGDNDSAALSIISNAGTTNSDKRSGLLVLGRTRGTSNGSNTVVVQDDQVGMIEFKGMDGTSFTTAATIKAQVDGSVGTDDMPGRLIFSTTPDNAAIPQERLRITSSGNFHLSTGELKTSAGDKFANIRGGGVINTTRHATGQFANSAPYSPQVYGYIGDYMHYGCNAIYYLAQTTSGNSGYSSHMFSWYDSGHWGHYGKFVLICQEAGYIGGIAHRYLSGTTVSDIFSIGNAGGVSTTQTQTGSGTHSGQSVTRYDCTVSHTSTYRTMRWYLGVLHGAQLGVTGSGKSQSDCNTYANSNGSLLHLFGVSDSNLTMAPNYRTW